MSWNRSSEKQEQWSPIRNHRNNKIYIGYTYNNLNLVPTYKFKYESYAFLYDYFSRSGPGFNPRLGQFPGWGFFRSFLLTVGQMSENWAKFVLGYHITIKHHPNRLRTATVSDLSCSSVQISEESELKECNTYYNAYELRHADCTNLACISRWAGVLVPSLNEIDTHNTHGTHNRHVSH